MDVTEVPIIANCKDEAGLPVPIDVTQMLSKDTLLQQLVATALEKFTKDGGVVDGLLYFSIIVTDGLEHIGASLMSVPEDGGLDAELYSPIYDEIQRRDR